MFDTILAVNRDGTATSMVEQNAKKGALDPAPGFVLELGRNRFDGTGGSC